MLPLSRVYTWGNGATQDGMGVNLENSGSYLGNSGSM